MRSCAANTNWQTKQLNKPVSHLNYCMQTQQSAALTSTVVLAGSAMSADQVLDVLPLDTTACESPDTCLVQLGFASPGCLGGSVNKYCRKMGQSSTYFVLTLQELQFAVGRYCCARLQMYHALIHYKHRLRGKLKKHIKHAFNMHQVTAITPLCFVLAYNSTALCPSCRLQVSQATLAFVCCALPASPFFPASWSTVVSGWPLLLCKPL